MSRMVELKRKDGKPFFALADQIAMWMESTESPHYTSVWISGKEFTLGQPVHEVTQILRHTLV